MLVPTTAIAADPIKSSNFAGAQNPLKENGAWVPMYSMSPDHVQFQKNNGAFAGSFNGAHNNHASARTTAAVPVDQYSEIVVGHVGTNRAYVGPMVRVQTSGPAVDSQYTWWTSLAGGDNLELYRFDCNGTSYSAQRLIPNTPVADGDRLRLIARGPVIYGIKNGVRDFIYNTGKDTVRYDRGTTGILAYSAGPTLTDAKIASWSTGAAPVSSGTWASTTFDGAENPLDEGDRWYPLPLAGSPAAGTRQFTFKKAGGVAMSNSPYEQGVLSGVWSIAPPPTQYSEVTLGPVDPSSGGGVVVRIDRTSLGPTGWLLFVWADSARNGSGIYKLDPVGEAPTLVRPFNPTVAAGDKWRLAASGNTLEVFQNGISQFTYTTDGSYPTGDVGIEAYSAKFTFDAWEGGEMTSPPPPTLPTISGFAPTSAPVGTSVLINGTNFSGASAVTFNGTSASFSVTSATAIQATVPAGATSGPIGVTTPSGTANSAGDFTVTATPPPTPPTITDFAPGSAPVGTSIQINGTNLDGASSVTFNGTNASFSVTSATAIQATVPSGATTGPISVTTPSGTATSAGDFTVTAAPPTITSFGPTSGPVGTSVQINGTSLDGASTVTFNGVSANFTVTSSTTIQATVPGAATTGAISVTTPGGTATSANSFTVMVRLSVTKTSTLGVGRGTVASTSSPDSANQIDCGSNCSVDFAQGTVVTLTATPALLSAFDGWTGCDSASGTTCTVTLTSARAVTARFLP
jgi:hypothetical protein